MQEQYRRRYPDHELKSQFEIGDGYIIIEKEDLTDDGLWKLADFLVDSMSKQYFFNVPQFLKQDNRKPEYEGVAKLIPLTSGENQKLMNYIFELMNRNYIVVKNIIQSQVSITYPNSNQAVNQPITSFIFDRDGGER